MAGSGRSVPVVQVGANLLRLGTQRDDGTDFLWRVRLRDEDVIALGGVFVVVSHEMADAVERCVDDRLRRRCSWSEMENDAELPRALTVLLDRAGLMMSGS